MAVLNRDQIFAAEDVKTEIVSVPEWGGDLRIQMLTGVQRDEWDSQFEADAEGNIDRKCYRNIRARLVAMCAVDEEGNQIFGPGDAEKLGKKSAKALNRVYRACRELSGMNVEAVAKNSEETPAEDSSED